jgi:hypothetical protein
MPPAKGRRVFYRLAQLLECPTLGISVSADLLVEELLPTILRVGPYRFYFYSHDLREPPHVHVDAGDKTAKLWLNPVAVARNMGFAAVELSRIKAMVTEHRAEFIEAWNEHFGR